MLFSFFEKRTGLFERLSKCVLFLSCVVRCAARSTVTATLFFFFFSHFFEYFSVSGQAVVTEVSSLLPPVLAFNFFIAHGVQQSHYSSFSHRVVLTHALALSASQFVHKKKPTRICMSMHSGGFELTKLTYTRPEDNLIRHRGDRPR